jgi:DNA repair protein RadC
MNPIEQYLKDPFLEYSDLDLLSLLIGGERRRAQKTAYALMDRFGSLKRIAQLDAQILRRCSGIGSVTAVRIHAGLRAGRRALFYQAPVTHIRTPQDAFDLLWAQLIGQAEEQLWVLYLDRKKRLIMQKKMTQGNDQFTIVDPKQIYQVAFQIQSSGIIIAHNHPSDDPTPSEQDIQVTERIANAGLLLNIPLIDHLIIGNDSFCSFALLGLLQPTKRNRMG